METVIIFLYYGAIFALFAMVCFFILYFTDEEFREAFREDWDRTK